MSEGPRFDADPSLVNEGRVKTSLYCHECGKTFIAEIDYDQDGQHEIHCAYCDHTHYRLVEKGKVTSERWHADATTIAVKRVWKCSQGGIQRTSTAADFLRDRWLQRLE